MSAARHRPGFVAAALLSMAAVAAAPAVQACGYHDPSSINLGMLNWSYPDALHVRTAVWMAQQDGALARDPPEAATDLQSATIKAMFRLRETVTTLGAFGDRVGANLDGRQVPAFSVVLIGPMLWSRFEQAGTALAMAAHVAGPASGDVVIVTDAPVVAALLEGRLSPDDARKLGLLRLYGAEDRTGVVASLLDRVVPVTSASAAGRPGR